MIREDFIHRLIRQFAEMMARAAGFRRRGDYDAALRATAEGWELLGVPRELAKLDSVEVLDTRTLAGLLGDPAKIRAAAQLLGEEARVLTGKRDPINAAIVSRRALELYVAARAIEPTDVAGATPVEIKLTMEQIGDEITALPTQAVKVVDTSGAGDSFNGAYLAARLKGKPPQEAVKDGLALAARVVAQPGALIPR